MLIAYMRLDPTREKIFCTLLENKKKKILTPSYCEMATTTQVATKAPNATDVMLERAEKAQTKPLWLQMARLNPPVPNPKCTPYLWRYSDIRPSLLEAGELVPEHQAERRVLMLVNPSRGIIAHACICIEKVGVWVGGGRISLGTGQMMRV